MRAAKNQFFDYRCVSVECAFRQCAPAALIARINIGALVEEVTNCIEPPFARSEEKWCTATALTIDLGARHLQQTHAAHVSLSGCAREVCLTARTSARQ